MTALGIKPSEVIAEIGAGSGYFTFYWHIMSETKGRFTRRTRSGYDPALQPVDQYFLIFTVRLMERIFIQRGLYGRRNPDG